MVKIWYRDATKPVRSDDFILNGYGVREAMVPGIVDRPRGTGDFLFMIFHDAVMVRVAETVCRIGPKTLMLWQPGRYQLYGNPDRAYVHSWIHCSGRLVERQIRECGLALNVPLHGMEPEEFEYYVRAVHYECARTLEPDLRIIENQLRNLLYAVQRATRAPGPASRAPQALIEARRFIEDHYCESINLQQLARIANVSPQHFCTQFRRVFGRAPISYLLDYRLARAAYLLCDRNTRVGEAAQRVGIDDVYYFSRAFKKRYGKSPREMRDSQRDAPDEAGA